MGKGSVRAFGLAYTQPPLPEGANGIFDTKAELREKARNLVGTPVIINHGALDPADEPLVALAEHESDMNEPIGTVLAAGLTPETNRLWIEFDLRRDTLKGCDVIRRAREGKLSLSLGQTMKIGEYSRRVWDKQVHEVSLVRVPDHPGAHVFWVEDDSDDWKEGREVLERALKHLAAKPPVAIASEQSIDRHTVAVPGGNSSIFAPEIGSTVKPSIWSAFGRRKK